LTILDANALLAVLLDEPEAPRVEKLLRSDRCVMPLANAAEVIDICLRVQKFDDEQLYRVMLPLLDNVVEVIPGTLTMAWRAAELRARHYNVRSRPVSLPDCMLIASAASGDRVATKDQAVLDVARAEGVAVLPLV
jgi:predicted nucleic acid-binding protein